RQYAKTLVEMARSVMEAGARVKFVGVAMPGGSLHRRIQQIVESGPAPRLSRLRMTWLAPGFSVISVAFAIGTLSVRGQPGQRTGMPDWQVAAGGSAKFDVASVKPNTTLISPETISSNVPLNSAGDGFNPTGGLFRAINHPLTDYLAFAY